MGKNKPAVKLVTGPIVRYVDQTSATIWVELDEGAALYGDAKALRGTKKPAKVRSAYAHTTPVNALEDNGAYGRYYAVVRFEGLKPATLYSYSLTAAYDPNQDLQTVSATKKARHRITFDLSACAFGGNSAPAFRTLPTGDKEALRIAFGSCRNLDGGYNDEEGHDVLAAYSEYLGSTHDDRLTTWPSLLLLLGDQIYCDDVAQRVVDKILEYRTKRIDAGKRVHKGLKNTFSPDFSKIDQHLKDGWISTKLAGYSGFHCQSFEEWALLYETAWNEPEVRRLLANIPTFMIPDDHELANGFDITAGWHEQMNNDRDWRAALRDGMLAFWLYQGWGNVSKKAAAAHPILELIEAALVGDALGEPASLGTAIEKQLDRDLHAPVYFTIPTTPPVIVLDARADREFVAPVQDTVGTGTKVIAYRHPDDMILGTTQFTWLEEQMEQSETPIIASSVPFLQTLIGDRLLLNTRVLPSQTPQVQTSQDAVDAGESIARELDAETWYAWPRSVERLLELIAQRRSVVLLAGDVHYSYLFDTNDHGFDTASFGIASSARLIQAVSSPLRYPLKQGRIDGVEAFGGFYMHDKDIATGRWGDGGPEAGNREHDLRETFDLPIPVFPDDASDAWTTFHGGRYTTENVIAVAAVKKGKLAIQWLSHDGQKLVVMAEYEAKRRL